MAQSNLGKKWFISSCLQLTGPHWRKSGHEIKQGKILEAGTQIEAMEECYLLACSSQLGQFTFLYLQDHLPRSSTTQSWLRIAISTINGENTPTGLPTGQSSGNIFFFNFGSLFSDDRLMSSRLTSNTLWASKNAKRQFGRMFISFF